MSQSIQKPRHFSPKGFATVIVVFAAFVIVSIILAESASSAIRKRRAARNERRRVARRKVVTIKVPRAARLPLMLPPAPLEDDGLPPSRTKWSDLFPNGVPTPRRNQSRELSFSRPLTIPAHLRAAPELATEEAPKPKTRIVELEAPPSRETATPIPETLRSAEAHKPKQRPPISAWMTTPKPKNPDPPKCKIPRPDSRPAVDQKQTIAPTGTPRPRKITMRWGGVGQKWPPPNTAPQRPGNTHLH